MRGALMLLLLLLGAAHVALAARQKRVAIYLSGLFDQEFPSPEELRRLQDIARRAANSGADILLPCMIHIYPNSSLYYNNLPIIYCECAVSKVSTCGPCLAHCRRLCPCHCKLVALANRDPSHC